MLMRKQVPFYKQISLYSKKIKKTDNKGIHSPPTTKLLSSPKMLSKFAPVSPMIKRSPKAMGKDGLKKSSILEKFTARPEDGKATAVAKDINDEPKLEASKMMKAQHIPWIDSSKTQETLMSPNLNTEVIRMPNATKVSQTAVQKAKEEKSDMFKSPSLILLDSSGKDEVGTLVYCECGNFCEGESTLCSACMKNKESIENSGYLYLKAKSTKLKRYWYILLNKELYCTQSGSFNIVHRL